jgi:hypothetical protein
MSAKMMLKSKAALVKEAKALGIKVGKDWKKKDLVEAITLAKEVDEVTEEPEPIVTKPMEIVEETKPIPPVEIENVRPIAPPAPPPVVPKPAPAPKPLAKVVPVKPAKPAVPPPKKSGQAGRYKVLWTITINGEAIHEGEVYLNDAQAKSLVDQGAVVHVDDYPAYLKQIEAANAKPGEPALPPKQVPRGAGRYRTVCGITRRGGEVIDMGVLADFTAEEVESLAKQGAIEYP